jgi:hypothetical protein
LVAQTDFEGDSHARLGFVLSAADDWWAVKPMAFPQAVAQAMEQVPAVAGFRAVHFARAAYRA